MLLNCGVGEDSWESLGLQGDPASPFWRSALVFLWKDWCWSWSSNTLDVNTSLMWRTDSLEKTLRLGKIKARGEGDDRGWDGWMASLTQWTWVWASSGSWWWTGRPLVLQSMGLQRVGHNWATELNWMILLYAMFCVRRDDQDRASQYRKGIEGFIYTKSISLFISE